MDKFKISENAEIKLEAAEKKTIMHWRGAIDVDTCNDSLGKFLLNFHSKCKEQGVAELDVNFCMVDFMNSAGITNVISWLRDVSNDNLYKATVLFDPAISWQDVTFETFAQLICNVNFKKR